MELEGYDETQLQREMAMRKLRAGTVRLRQIEFLGLPALFHALRFPDELPPALPRRRLAADHFAVHRLFASGFVIDAVRL